MYRSNFQRSILVAAGAGLLAATPISILLLAGPAWLDASWAPTVVIPAVAVCPPWWLFGSVLGRPDDMQFALWLSGLVVVLNALLYAPLGVLHGAVLDLRPAMRRTLVAMGLGAVLAIGHAIFMAELVPLGALLGRHAA